MSVGVWTSHQAHGDTRGRPGRCSEAGVRQYVTSKHKKGLANIFLTEMLWFHAMRKNPIFYFPVYENYVPDLKLLEDYDNEEAWISAVNKRNFFDRILIEYDPSELSGPEYDDDDTLTCCVIQNGRPAMSSSRPNHCGRHLGKVNGHKSTYVKVWRCTFFSWITMFLTENPWVKLFDCQAEVFGWLTQALKFCQRPIQSCNRPRYLS